MKQASFSIDPRQPGYKVDANIYGHFAEHLGRCIYNGVWVGEESEIPNDGGIRRDTVEALRRLALPVLRWPGGCFADNYHWRDGIGPRAQRPMRLNIWWKQGESNAFGTHEFIRFCRMIGAEPYLCCNVGSGSVEEARSWVEYCNAAQDTTLTRERAANGCPEPFNVKYWGIGNENWGCGGSMTPEYYAHLYRQYATYLRHLAGGVMLVACGSHDGIPDWDERFFKTLKGAEKLVDAIALHNYSGGLPPPENGDEDAYHKLLATVHNLDAHIRRAREICLCHAAGDHRAKVIMDEWGTWYTSARTPNGLRQENTMQDAIFTALAFHMFHRHAEDLVMTNMAQTINVLQALVLTEGPKLCVTPTYWIYDLFKPHRDGAQVPTTGNVPARATAGDAFIPVCSASATVANGKLAISLVNTDLQDRCEATVRVKNNIFAAPVRARLLSSERISDRNTPDAPNAVAPQDLQVTAAGDLLTVRLPPLAVAMVEAGIG